MDAVLARLESLRDELLEAGRAPSPHTVASYLRRPDLRLSLGQLTRLDGEHLVIADDPGAPIVALVQHHRSRHLTPVEIPYDGTAGCPTTALRELGPPRWGPVFHKDNNDQRLSRERVRRIVVTTVTAAGIPPQLDTTIPALDSGQRTQLGHHLQADATAALRARAVLLTGSWAAVRGAELSGLRWGHAKHVERGVEWHTPEAKNNQLGQGRTTGVPLVDDPFLCAVQAINDWRNRLETLTGRPVGPRDHVFCALDRGRPDPIQPLSRAALSDLGAATAQTAGLGPGCSTHSLRAGFVTDAIDAGARPEQIAHHGRWTNTNGLATSYRRRELWAPGNPALQIATTLTTPRYP